MWLYRLTNVITNKAYIGTSVNPISHRISRHVYAAKTGREDMAIADAIKKYGIEKFRVECIGTASDYEELLRMEAAAIIEQNTRAPHGYNITAGGRGTRRKHSENTKRLIAESHKGKKPWNYGLKTGPLSQEHRNKLSKSHEGKSTWNKGIPHTAEHLAKLKGRKAWNKGRKSGPMSEAQRLAIAETMRKVRAERNWSTKKSNSFLPFGA